MGILPWDLGPGFGFNFVEPVRTPRLTVWCEYEDMAPTEVTFRLSPHYGSPQPMKRTSGSWR